MAGPSIAYRLTGVKRLAPSRRPGAQPQARRSRDNSATARFM